MADLTSDVALRFRFPSDLHRERWTVDTSGAQTIYKGQPIFIDVNVDSVNARGYLNADTAATGDVFLGFASHGLTVASGATESETSLEIITAGEVGFQISTFTDADAGKAIYMADSGSFTLTNTANLPVGNLVRVVDGWAYIRFTAPAVATIA